MTKIINWNELWRMTRWVPSGRKGPNEFIDMKMAKGFNETVKGHKERTGKQIASIKLGPEYTVLDVGAGTGRLAIPIAKNVKKVTAIEPSESMLACLDNNMKTEGVTNIACINKMWDDIEIGVDIEPHDVVIASHSFEMLGDIQEALKKIDSAAKKSAYIFTFVENERGIMWMNDDLWNQIYGKRGHIWSDYIYLYIALHEMGIYANVNIFDSKFDQACNNLDHVVNHRRDMYETPLENEAILKEHLSKMLTEKDGSTYLNGSTKSAVIWWTNDEHKG